MSDTRYYFGGDLRSFRAHAGLRLSEVDYTIRTWAPHIHSRAFFALLLRGHYVENLRDARLSYEPFDLGFHPEGTHHADQIAADDTRFFLVELDAGWVNRLRELKPTAVLEPRMCTPRDAWLASRLHREHREGGEGSSLVAESLVLDMLAGLLPGTGRSSRERPRWLRTVLDMLEAEFPLRLSLDSIAREVSLHPVYVSRAFRELTGQSVSERLTEARIRFAMRKLAVSGAPLSEIALAAGFADQSHFTRVFKRETGTTPSAFRRTAATSAS